MHRRSVIHRDLKMGNIFLNAHMNLQIGDFGLAAVMADENDRRTTLCGTPNYIAPEILSKSGTRGHDNKVDTWAIGVICYAMLVGTPPFQSKSQQEIYAKLRSLEYEWKIDCKNYIPQQAKDFVASCLNLVSADRPEMDDLVEHEFFTMGVVADELETDCLKNRPDWLLNADPRGDKVKPGYGITHSQICRASGVGRGVDGRPRPGVGAKSNISTLVEIEAENRQGCAPTVPLPEGMLYKAFTEAHAEWALRQNYPIQPANPRSRKPTAERAETQGSERALEDAVLARIPTMKPSAASSVIQSARSVPSFAAQQRQQALPSRPVPRQVKEKETDGQLKEAPEVIAAVPTSEGLLKARPVRAASVRVTRSTAAQSSGIASLTKTLPKSSTLPVLADTGDRRAGKKVMKTEGEVPAIITSGFTRPNIRVEENATFRPRTTQNEQQDTIPARVLQPTAANDRLPPNVPLKTDSDLLIDSSLVPTTSSPIYRVTRQSPRIISVSDDYTSVKDSTNLQIHSYLQKLESALTPQSSTSSSHSVRSRRMRARLPYPRVDKWVDYSSRHGIAYILTDGTLGMIMRSSDDNKKPSSCVVVRNAKQHTVYRAKGVEHQFVPQGEDARDVEFFEQTDVARQMKKLAVPSRRFCLDLTKYSSQNEAAAAAQSILEGGELERFKEVALLDKFGKYMNKRCEESEGDAAKETTLASNDYFIHFYQRVGNVGVWRFSDGGLQFNFPDHTKITVYQDHTRNPEFLVDLVHLDCGDANHLTKHGRLTTDSLERRRLMTLSLGDVIADSLRATEADVVKSNEIKEKLSWIRAVVGCWIKEGGIGRMGEEKLGWSGLQERRDDKKVKLQWVTVGRLGGDGDVAPSR